MMNVFACPPVDDDSIKQTHSNQHSALKLTQAKRLLHWACEKGYTKIAQTSIRIGYDVNSKDTNEETPLHCACKNGYTI